MGGILLGACSLRNLQHTWAHYVICFQLSDSDVLQNDVVDVQFGFGDESADRILCNLCFVKFPVFLPNIIPPEKRKAAHLSKASDNSRNGASLERF